MVKPFPVKLYGKITKGMVLVGLGEKGLMQTQYYTSKFLHTALQALFLQWVPSFTPPFSASKGEIKYTQVPILY